MTFQQPSFILHGRRCPLDDGGSRFKRRFGHRRVDSGFPPTATDGRYARPEALAGDAVEEEVDGMIDVDEFVVDDLRYFVERSVLPVGFADEEDDARSDADEEAEGGAEAHGRHLDEGFISRRDDRVLCS